MPGKYTKEFEDGQLVAFSDEKWARMSHKENHRVARVVGIDGIFVTVSHWIKGREDKTGGFYPDSLMTHEETKAFLETYPDFESEEELYNCSYCGLEGHNRRTCPKLSSAEKDSKEVVSMLTEYANGPELEWEAINRGDLIQVKRSSKDAPKNVFENGTFEVGEVSTDADSPTLIRTRVVSVSGTTPEEIAVNKERIGSFGKTWNFDVTEWTFYQAIEVTDKMKELRAKDIWALVEVVLPVSRLTLLYGPPGTGKTTAGNYLGSPKEVFNLTLTEETPAAELRGHFIPKGNEFVWMDGPALTAFKRGGRLVLNEIDKASGDALTFCHALLDDPGIARITLPYKDEHGETVSVEPHEDFNVVATMNGEPEDLPEALRDRFAVRLHVDKVHPNAIKALPADLQKIASKGLSKDGDRSVSIRGWNAFVQLREILGEHDAARAVFGHRADTILNTIKIDSLETGKK
jgi:hypothetical protein